MVRADGEEERLSSPYKLAAGWAHQGVAHAISALAAMRHEGRLSISEVILLRSQLGMLLEPAVRAEVSLASGRFAPQTVPPTLQARNDAVEHLRHLDENGDTLGG